MSGKVLFIHEYSIYLMKYSILDELLLYIKSYLNIIAFLINKMLKFEYLKIF